MPGRNRGGWLLSIAWLACAVACSEETPGRLVPQYQGMRYVSLFPGYRDEGGQYMRQCGSRVQAPRDADLLLFGIGILGTNRGVSEDSGERDNDLSIRPGDRLRKNVVSDTVDEGTFASDLFRIDIDCLEPRTDRYSAGKDACRGVPGAGNGVPLAVRYLGFDKTASRSAPEDRDATALAVMVDQSGSMKGFVETESGLEVMGGSFGPWENDFKDHATDTDGERFTAIRSLFSLLNANDRAGVFQFGEGVGPEAAVVCDLDPDLGEALRRIDCFGTNRELITGSTMFNRLPTGPRGRTPLWSSVASVYGFLKDGVPARVRHVLVITDGPDTCHPDSPDFMPMLRHRVGSSLYKEVHQEAACSDVSYDAFLDRIAADVVDGEGNLLAGNRVPVHVSFVQIQAPGYPDPDPRQVEVACLTGGMYRFVNRNELPPEQKCSLGGSSLTFNPFREAMLEAVNAFRYSIAGSWNLAVQADPLAAGKLPDGSSLAVAAGVRLLEGPLTPGDHVDLRVGHVLARSGDGECTCDLMDMRGWLHRPCSNGDDCSWVGAGDDCREVACREADRRCVLRFRESGAGCDGGGSCCWGACSAPIGECRTLDSLCNVVDLDDVACAGGVCCKGECRASCP